MHKYAVGLDQLVEYKRVKRKLCEVEPTQEALGLITLEEEEDERLQFALVWAIRIGDTNGGAGKNVIVEAILSLN